MLEALRQPLEDGVVSVARVGGRGLFPARVRLVATIKLWLFRVAVPADLGRRHRLEPAPTRSIEEAVNVPTPSDG